ncbi:MAG: hypothetical protein ORN29_08245 [Rhodoferax sp.]|nr:hypothetical protein [Rhodoferax sp.]
MPLDAPAMSASGANVNTGADRGSRLVGIALIALAALSWSTAGLFPRLVSTDVFTTLFWRSLLGACRCWCCTWFSPEAHLFPNGGT